MLCAIQVGRLERCFASAVLTMFYNIEGGTEFTVDNLDNSSSLLPQRTLATAHVATSDSPASAEQKDGGQRTGVSKSLDRCAKDVWDNEKALVEAWQEDINYLLLFVRICLVLSDV